MTLQRPSGSRARFIAATTVLVILAVLTMVSAAPALAGPPPNRLDDNRGRLDFQTAVNTFVAVPPSPLAPFFLSFPPLLPPPTGPLTPRVLENPSIFNVYWDPDWDDHHSGAFSTESIDDMTKKLVESNYFSFAGQYDVGAATFDDSNTSGGFGNPCPDSPGAETDFLQILSFIECETNIFAPTGVPSPGGDSLYVVYLPRGTTIDNFGINKSCESFGAYHFMGTTLGGTALTPLGAEVAFAAIPIDCAKGSADKLSKLASHEIIEASTDPNVVMGWINDDKVDLTNLKALFTEGEAADICDPDPKVGDVPTDPVRLDNGILVATYWSNQDNACVPFPTADLAITKTDSPDPVNAGEQLYYTLTVTNNGPNDVPDASVTDTLPPQVEFVTDDRGICTEAPAGTLTCNFGKVPNGASSTVVIKVQVKANTVSDAGHATGITNTAEVSSAKVQDPNPANNKATASTIVEDLADLEVTKLCKPDTSPSAGQPIDCSIFVDNHGPSYARGVVATDTTLSNGTFTISNIVPSQGTCGAPTPVTGGQKFECNLGSVAAASTSVSGRATITYRVSANEGQDINNAATVRSDTPDPDSSNNSATVTLTVHSVADLALAKSGPASVVAGTGITWNLNLTNAGPSTAKNVVVTDDVPAGVTITSVSAPGGSCNAGVAGDPFQPTTCTFASFTPGGPARTMTINATVNSGTTGILHNDARVASDTFDSNNANDLAHADTNVTTSADLALTYSSDSPTYKPSSTIHYKVSVANNGPSDAIGVVTTVQLPPAKVGYYVSDSGGCTLSSATLTCPMGTIVAGSPTRTIFIDFFVQGSKGTVTSTASVASPTPDPDSSNNSATVNVAKG